MKSVLVIEEDDFGFYFPIEEMKEYDIETIKVRNAYEALEVIKNSDIEFAFIDAVRPGNEDAIEITKKIKTIAPSVPIILISFSAAPDIVINSFNAGCDDYILKPLTADKLYRILEKRRYLINSLQ